MKGVACIMNILVFNSFFSVVKSIHSDKETAFSTAFVPSKKRKNENQNGIGRMGYTYSLVLLYIACIYYL